MVYNHEMLSFCAEIGMNRLLVQGAGGNASWKENNTLWIKASGMWLVDAKSHNIFLPIDLGHLREKLARNNELKAYKHDGFWHCVDTRRDKDNLEKIFNQNK